MALAIQTKLLAGIVVPAVGLHILFGTAPEATPGWLRRRVVQLTVWLAVAGAAFLAIGFYFQALRPDLLLGTHLGAQTQAAFVDEAGPTFLLHFAEQHAAYLVLAAIGAGWAIWRRNRAVILPLTWFLTALVALTFHRPVWYHHVQLLTIPLCWLCAFAVELWVRGVRRLFSGTEVTHRFARGTGLVVAAGAFVGARDALSSTARPASGRTDDHLPAALCMAGLRPTAC